MDPWREYLEALEGTMLRSRGALYLSIPVALDALPWLAEHSYVVLGFDGIDTDGQRLLPRLDYIADFGDIPGARSERVQRSIAMSHETLSAWLGRVHFVDLVVEPPSE